MACSGDKKVSTKPTESPEMDSLRIDSSEMDSTSIDVPNTAYYTVSGLIEKTGVYCGGAAPPEELLRKLRQKKPLAGYMLYIRKGNTNAQESAVIDSTTTRTDGTFEFQLPPGEYVLLARHHKHKTILQTWQDDKNIKITDQECLEKWWENGLTKLNVRDHAINTINFHFQEKCFLPLGVPCLDYVGTLPP